MSARVAFTITLVAESDGDSNNSIHRLRRLLKIARRQFGLRCVDIREQPRRRELLAPRTSSKQEHYHGNIIKEEI